MYMRIEDLCVLERKLTEEETRFVKVVTDEIYKLYCKNNNLPVDYLEGLMLISQKMGINYFNIYSEDFIRIVEIGFFINQNSKRVEMLCSLFRKLNSFEHIYIYSVIDLINEFYENYKVLLPDYLDLLKQVNIKVGNGFFYKYSYDFRELSRALSDDFDKFNYIYGVRKKGKKNKNKKSKKDKSYVNYQSKGKYAYLSYRYTPYKSGIKIYHY